MKLFKVYFHMVLFGFRYFFQNKNLRVFLNFDLGSPGTESEGGGGAGGEVLKVRRSKKLIKKWDCITKPGGLLPYKRLMGMCRWMGSHFQKSC